MQDFAFLEQDIKNISVEYVKNAMMSSYTSFKIGGPCDFLVIPKMINEILSVINLANEKNIPLFFLGNGSDLLVSDSGIRGIVVLLSSNFSKIEVIGEEKISVQSGASISKLCKFCLDRSLSGIEFAWGIPGTVGGAVYMNAGAYGGEIKDVVCSVTYINENMQICEKNVSQLDFSYRHSFFSDKNLCILSAEILLKKENSTKIKSLMDEYITRRKNKQPLEYASGGSTFKRPIGNYAGTLIEQCGLKGYTIGDAMVSTKHCGFIINKGNATYQDVINLIEYVKQVVFKKTGYQLECEIKCVKG